jgi:hypothetical protein
MKTFWWIVGGYFLLKALQSPSTAAAQGPGTTGGTSFTLSDSRIAATYVDNGVPKINPFHSD